MTSPREHELHCTFCPRAPLLATYGVRKGKLFVRVKVWKQNRLFAEVIAEGGHVKLRCRNCLRWCTVVFGKESASLSPPPVPAGSVSD